MSDLIRNVEARLYGVPEVAKRLDISRSRVFQLIRSGDLRAVKVGQRRLVSEQALFDFIDDLENGDAAK